MDSFIDLILSVAEPNLWVTVLNIAIIIFAIIGVALLIRSWIEARKMRCAEGECSARKRRRNKSR